MIEPYLQAKDGEVILYLDFNSLYSYCMAEMTEFLDVMMTVDLEGDYEYWVLIDTLM